MGWGWDAAAWPLWLPWDGEQAASILREEIEELVNGSRHGMAWQWSTDGISAAPVGFREQGRLCPSLG